MTPDFRHQQLRAYYRTLHAAWGPQHWWPARTPFEVIVGAFLTQNTSWKNVELALQRMREKRLLSLAAVRRVPLEQLEAAVRSAGYYRQKAARLKTFVAFVDRRYRGSLRRMFTQPTEKLRDELLALNGVGPETADSILLYAGQHPVFVVDAYTRRLLERHGIVPADTDYEEIRSLFEHALSTVPALQQETGVQPNPSYAHSPSPMSLVQRSAQAQVFNDMHGLIVVAGKQHCHKSSPRCEHCPLQRFLP